MGLLQEILGLTPQPYKWVSDNKCTFEFKDRKFGIYVEFQELNLSTKLKASVANISFGVLKGDSFNAEDDLDTSLTGFGSPRLIFSTVADACIKNAEIVKSDIICLAGSDESKDKRALLYSVALAEIRSRVKEFHKAKDITAKTSNGTILTLLSKIKFTDEEKEEIKDELLISK
jgi:hypothetical protein